MKKVESEHDNRGGYMPIQYENDWHNECECECDNKCDNKCNNKCECDNKCNDERECPKCHRKCHKEWKWCPWCNHDFHHGCC